VTEDAFVSIVRIGLAETKNFAEGYEAIFGKKKETTDKTRQGKTTAKGGATKGSAAKGATAKKKPKAKARKK
jgi:hypothetical protein